jgi:TRAP-type C4-dicarboxylate transport system permease small subunit
MRYVMNSPVGWTVEVCVIAWLWILLWGQSVSAREEDEIRFDILYGGVSPELRRWFRIVFSVFLVGIYTWSLPALWDFVTFMKIQKTSYLDIRFNWVYSIALVFSVVSILRYLWILGTSFAGRDAPEVGGDTATRKDFTE